MCSSDPDMHGVDKPMEVGRASVHDGDQPAAERKRTTAAAAGRGSSGANPAALAQSSHSTPPENRLQRTSAPARALVSPLELSTPTRSRRTASRRGPEHGALL